MIHGGFILYKNHQQPMGKIFRFLGSNRGSLSGRWASLDDTQANNDQSRFKLHIKILTMDGRN